MKATPQFLTKLEDIFSESDFVLRYEKGNFKSGYCILNEQKVIVVNKFYPLEGKITCLIEILRTISLDTSGFKEKTKELYTELTQTQIAITF
jgi:hypothetical protein